MKDKPEEVQEPPQETTVTVKTAEDMSTQLVAQLEGLGEAEAPPLPKAWWGDVCRLFASYDMDHSGMLDAKEFTVLLQKMEPEVDESAVLETFEAVGASEGGLDLLQLCQWMHNMFEGSSHEEFREGIEGLLQIKDDGVMSPSDDREDQMAPMGATTVASAAMTAIRAGMSSIQRQYKTLTEEMRNPGGVLVTYSGGLQAVNLRKLKEHMARLQEEQAMLQTRHLAEPHNDTIESRLDEIQFNLQTMRTELKSLHTDVLESQEELREEHPLQRKETETRLSLKTLSESLSAAQGHGMNASLGLVLLLFWEDVKRRALLSWRLEYLHESRR